MYTLDICTCVSCTFTYAHTSFTPLFTCSVVESKTGQFHCSLNANTSYRVFSNIHAVCTYAHQRKHTLETLVGETYACLLCDISRKHAIEMRACTDTQVFTESGCAILCTLRCVLWLRIMGEMPAGATVASLGTLKSTVFCLEMDMWIAIWAAELGKQLFTAFTVH